MGKSAKKAWSVAMLLIMALSMVSTAALQAFADEAGAASAVQLTYDNSYGVRNVGGENYALMEVIATDDQPGRLDLVDTSGKVVHSQQFTVSKDNSGKRPNNNLSKDIASLSAEAFCKGFTYLFAQGDGDSIVPISYNGSPLVDGSYSSVSFDEPYGTPIVLCRNESNNYVDVLDAEGKQILHVDDAVTNNTEAFGNGIIEIALKNGSTRFYRVGDGVAMLAAETQNKVLTYFLKKSNGAETMVLVEKDSDTGEVFFKDGDQRTPIEMPAIPDGAHLYYVLASSSDDESLIRVLYLFSNNCGTVTGFYGQDGKLIDGFHDGRVSYPVSIGDNRFVQASKPSEPIDADWAIVCSDSAGNELWRSVLTDSQGLGYHGGIGLVGNYIVVSGDYGTGGQRAYVCDTEGNLKLSNLYSFYKTPFGGYSNAGFGDPVSTPVIYDENLNVAYEYDSSRYYRDETVTLANGQVVAPTNTFRNNGQSAFSPAMSMQSSAVLIAGYQIGTCSINGGVLSLSRLNNQLARDNGNFIYACDANGKYGAIDAQGNVRLPFEYDAYFDSGDGNFAMVKKDGTWSFLDLSDALKKDPIDISTASISASEFVYDGKSAVVPALTVKDGDKALVEGTDFKVSSVDYDLSAGSGSAIVEGIGAYTGTATAAFAITTPDSLRFPDVAQSEWYFESCAFAKANGLISGYDNGDFGPVDTLTRAQAAAILQRYFAPAEADAYVADGTENATGMVDVAGSTWYTGAANWAVREGVINGKEQADGSRLFDPEGDITREQLCAIVGNAAAKWCGAVVEGADRTKLDGLLGADVVSVWAIDSVAWGVNVGVINGVATDAGRDVDASASVQRSVMAAVMMNAIQNDVIRR